MTDSGLRRDYSRSRAVLMGCWDYAHLRPVQPASNSLKRMRELLTGPLCGWPADRVQELRNVSRRGDVPDRLMELFADTADVALFYFVGHGQLHGDELCLALRESPEVGPRRVTTGLPFSDVRAALRECDAKTKIVILDCCFSGTAARPEHGLTSASADVIDKTLGTGAFTMAASGAYRTAWFESDTNVDNPQTYFTKYLIDVVEQGLPGYPEGLPLGPVFARTADALARDRRPEPTRSVRHDADRFILAHNVAGAGVSNTSPTKPKIYDANKRRSRRPWAVLAAIALPCVLFGGALAFALNTAFGASGQDKGPPPKSAPVTTPGKSLYSSGGESTHPTTTSPSPSMSNRDKQFAAVKAGDCFDTVYDLLDGYALDDDGGGPEVVPCTSPRAYYKVTHIYRPATNGACTETDDGRGEWPNSGPGRSDVTLCIDRFFQAGQCFLARGDNEPTSTYVLKGRDCSVLLNLDKPNNFLMKIIAVKPGSSTVNDCPKQYPGQNIYSTRALDDAKLLCLKVAIHGA
ncbi:caspase family protein [Streptomyces sp. NPDC048417]|uniref:caspase family protein n=1 Tax=Streptomyces sp. NPDC048417 TaxID=3155387 RepID=UPI0034466C41